MTLAQFGLLWERTQSRYEQTMHGPALICSVLANINRDAKKKRKPYTPADFLPQRDSRKAEIKEQTPEQMLAIAQMLFGPAKT